MQGCVQDMKKISRNKKNKMTIILIIVVIGIVFSLFVFYLINGIKNQVPEDWIIRIIKKENGKYP